MTAKIETPGQRNKLTPRNAPYWFRVNKGRFIGFRKGANKHVWVARMTVDGSFSFKTFHGSDEWEYETARDAADEWFRSIAVIEEEARNMTVLDVIKHYEKSMTVEKTPRYAKENSDRVRKHLSDHFKKTLLHSITTTQIKNFRNGIVVTGDEEVIRKSKVTANRTLNILKAALNLAYKDNLIDSKRAWETVEPFTGVSEARKLFLTKKQVNAYLKVTDGEFHNLCKALALTGNRVGSLTGALVRDLHPREGYIRLQSKKGSGAVKIWNCYLRDDSLEFFKEMSQSKLPNANLFTDNAGQPWHKNGYRRTMLDAKQAAKMPADFDLYAFRHYFISQCLEAGTQPQVIAENVGTSVRMIELHYGKTRGETRRALMNKVQLGI
jgi:site-specific recombinase XerD